MQSNNAMKQRAQSERRTVDGEGMYQLVQQCRGAKVGLLGYVKHRFRLPPGVGPPSDKDGPTTVWPQAPQDSHKRGFTGAIWARDQKVLAAAHLQCAVLGEGVAGGRDYGKSADVQQHRRLACTCTVL